MNWSFSSLMDYESCPLRFKFKKIDRAPQLPLLPGNPMERGNRVHNRLELFVQDKGPIDTEAKRIDDFAELLEHLRVLHKAKLITTEQDWLYDRDWEECSRETVWLWLKLDFCVVDADNKLVVVGDYKTGKSQYKQIEHVQQLQLYAAVAALRFPWAETIHAELWYLDEGSIRAFEFTQEEALRFIARFDTRAQRIFNDRIYRPNPNKQTCLYCPFGPKNGTGLCPVGV